MSLYGIIKQNLTQDDIHQISNRLLHTGSEDHKLIAENWVIGTRSGHRQHCRMADGSHLILSGKLHNPNEIAVRIGSSLSTDAELMAHALNQFPEHAASWFKGDFVVVYWQPQYGRLRLIRDKVGARPVYYTMNNDTIAFATEAKALLSVQNATADRDGLSGYLLHSSAAPFTYGTTCFQGIKVLPPSHHLMWQLGGGGSLQSYWDFTFQPQLRKIKFDEACEEFRRLFHQAVLRRSGDETAVSVSGGLDSSSILCSLLHQKDRALPIAYFSNRVEVDETQFLKDIENQYGIAIHRLPMDELAGVEGTLAQQVSIVEAPFVDYLWNVSTTMLAEAKRLGAKTFLTGHFGDQMLFNWAYVSDLIVRGRWATAAQHIVQFSKWYDEDVTQLVLRSLPKSLLKQNLPPSWFQFLKQIKNRVKKSASSPWLMNAGASETTFNVDAWPTAQSRSLYAQVRSRYHIQCLDWYSKLATHAKVEVGFPMFDVDLVEFLISLPGEIQNHKGIPRAILRESLREIIPSSIADRTWKSDFSNIVTDSVQMESSKLTGLLMRSPRMVKYGFVNEETLREKVAQTTAKITPEDCSAAWDLIDFAAFEHWLRIFIDQDKGDHP